MITTYTDTAPTASFADAFKVATVLRRQRRLPARTQLAAVGPGGIACPAWIERWTRRVVCVAGEVSFAVPLVITVARRAPLDVHTRLEAKLKAWGYLNVSLVTSTRTKE